MWHSGISGACVICGEEVGDSKQGKEDIRIRKEEETGEDCDPKW